MSREVQRTRALLLLAILCCLFRSVSAATATSIDTAVDRPLAAGGFSRTTIPQRTVTVATAKRTLAANATGATLLSEAFSTSATTPTRWIGHGDACLTAGTLSTPTTSIPACGAAAPRDAVGQGTLQLTTGAGSQSGMVVSRTALPTNNGLAVTFTDYSFNGSNSGADGIVFFFSDASKPIPGPGNGGGASLGYSGTTVKPGVLNAYVGIALDEYGNFSNPADGTGGPAAIPETIAVRGAASTFWAYLGGATNGAGRAASLPFNLDQPRLTTRPVNAPTIRATLTSAGALSVAIDSHNGSGFVAYYSQKIIGVNGQPTVPPNVYFGIGATTGGLWNRHQISGLVVSSVAVPPTTTTLLSEPFSGNATTPNAWTGYRGSCLTAGNTATPATSLPACGTSAAADPIGSGALQLTTDAGSQKGTTVLRAPLPTANGLAVTFTDYAFNGTNPGADGMSVFFTDASKPLPTPGGDGGGTLGYSGTAAAPGIANAYVGIGLDEYGNFSNPSVGQKGGPGRIPETVAVRGAAATLWQYLGGAHNAAGQPASLPFNLDQPLLTSRPTNAPTIRAMLSAAGILSVAIDHHDGSGFQTYYSQSIVGINAQPAVPAKVYLGFSAATGGSWSRHQIAGLTVTTGNSVAPIISVAPAAVSFSSPTAAAQNITISGGTAPFTLSGCANIAAGTMTNGVLKVSPTGVGACSLTITDANGNQAALSVRVNSPFTSSRLDNLTFHQNTLREGWYQYETVLNTANVASSSFGRIGTLTAPSGLPSFGKVYAQPLFVTNETTAVDGKQHNLVIVAGAAGQVYAFDETTRAMVWHRSFTNPAAGIRQQLWSDNGCTDINPDGGIVSTPVIDRSLDAIYVVVATMENGVPHTRLHALGLGSGNDLVAPTAITGSVALATGGIAAINSVTNMNRPALLEANGTIYVGLGSHCDSNAGTVHGWILGYNAATLAQTGSVVDVSNANDGSGHFLGSIWMSGFGPAADAAGNIYFATANGPYNGTSNFSMSILKVPGNLNVAQVSWFTPIQEASDSSVDQDLGSGGVMLLPDQAGGIPHLLVAGGKCSLTVRVGCFKYILNRDAMGGQQTNNAGALWSANTAGEMFGGPAYFVDASGAQHIVYGTGSPLSTYTLSLSPVGLSVQSSANVGCLECRNAGSQPIVSSNGRQTGSAVVWALRTPGGSGGTISLYAFDALNMSHTLFTGAAGTWMPSAGASDIGGALISPLVVDGRVYVPADGQVTVFGLPGE